MRATVGVTVMALAVPLGLTTPSQAAPNYTADIAVSAEDAKTGSQVRTRAGGTVRWTADYERSPSGTTNADVEVRISGPQTYRGGSFEAPKGWEKDWSTDNGSTWTSKPPANASQVNAVRALAPPGAPLTSTQSDFSKPTSPLTVQTTGQGDGWNLRFTADRIYAVNHHAPLGRDNWLRCYVKATGKVCPGWPQDGTYASSTAGQPLGQGAADLATMQGSDLWLDERPGQPTKLWTLTAKLTPSVQNLTQVPLYWSCVNVTLLESCGAVPTTLTTTYYDAFTSSKAPEAGMADRPFQGALYAYTFGGELTCLDLATGQLCSNNGTAIPARVLPPGGLTPPLSQDAEFRRFNNLGSNPIILGNRMIYNRTSVTPGKGELVCWNLSTNSSCGPLQYTTPAGAPTVQTQWAVTLLPAGSTSNPTGVCNLDYDPTAGEQWHCINWNNTPDPASAKTLQDNIPGKFFARQTRNIFTGRAYSAMGRTFGVADGSRMYLPYVITQTASESPTGQARLATHYACIDYARGMQPCAGYTPVEIDHATTRTYTLNVDPYNNCVWENGDAGRIVNFSGITGTVGGCGVASQAATTAAPLKDFYCAAGKKPVKSWQAVRVAGITTGVSRVTITDATGKVIVSEAVVPVSGEYDLSGLGFGKSVKFRGQTFDTTELTASVSVAGPDANDFSGGKTPRVILEWDGEEAQLCFETKPLSQCGATNHTLQAVGSHITDWGAKAHRSGSATQTITATANKGKCSPQKAIHRRIGPKPVPANPKAPKPAPPKEDVGAPQPKAVVPVQRPVPVDKQTTLARVHKKTKTKRVQCLQHGSPVKKSVCGIKVTKHKKHKKIRVKPKCGDNHTAKVTLKHKGRIWSRTWSIHGSKCTVRGNG